MSERNVVNDWLNEFKGKGTRNVYRSFLRKFQKFVGTNLTDYVSESRDFLKDFKAFVVQSPLSPILLNH